MRFVFDTNILLHYLRRTELAHKIDSEINPFSRDNTLILSIVSVGEIFSISIQNKWGNSKLAGLRNALQDFIIVASILNARLLTTDQDFSHLQDQFLDIFQVVG